MLTEAEIVVIGASAGAVEALGAILPRLPAGFGLPVVVVVHLSPRRPSLLASLFARRCALPVSEPFDKEPLRPGIFFAPPDYHLMIERDRSFALTLEPPVNWSRPAIDVLFESVADAYGASAVAVVLTGASSDGAKGARAVRDAGGTVLVQSPESAESSVMPEATIQLARPQMVGSLAEIATILGVLRPPPREPA
jgi:two-component system chemotaxis response regulator CheB